MLRYGEKPEERFDVLIGGCETVGELKEAAENYGMATEIPFKAVGITSV